MTPKPAQAVTLEQAIMDAWAPRTRRERNVVAERLAYALTEKIRDVDAMNLPVIRWYVCVIEGQLYA